MRYEWMNDLYEINRRSAYHIELAKVLLNELELKVNPGRVLDVGAGLGLTLQALSQLSDYFNDADLFLVEPSADNNGELNNHIRSFRGSKKILNDTLENLLPGMQLTGKFDVIIASHVFYYIKPIGFFLSQLRLLLSENGRMLVVLRNENSNSVTIRTVLGELLLDGKKYLHAEHLREELKQQKIDFQEIQLKYSMQVLADELLSFRIDDNNIIARFLKFNGHRNTYQWIPAHREFMYEFLTDLINKQDGRLNFWDTIFIIKHNY